MRLITVEPDSVCVFPQFFRAQRVVVAVYQAIFKLALKHGKVVSRKTAVFKKPQNFSVILRVEPKRTRFRGNFHRFPPRALKRRFLLDLFFDLRDKFPDGNGARIAFISAPDRDELFLCFLLA